METGVRAEEEEPRERDLASRQRLRHKPIGTRRERETKGIRRRTRQSEKRQPDRHQRERERDRVRDSVG